MSDRPIIVDSGTGFLKIGFAGDNFPTHSFRAVIGRPLLRYEEKLDDIVLKDIMIGDEVAPARGLLELSFPLAEGIIKNWDDMELIWEYGFKKLGVDTKGQSVLMTEAVMNPKENREKMAQIKFEKFGFGRLQVGIQALLPLFAEGLQTALLLDSGDGVTHCIPVVDGYCLNHVAQRLNIAGRHVTEQLVKLLFMRGYAFNSTADFELVNDIKERYCFASGDIRMDRKLASETTCHEIEHKLPDGSKIKIGRERQTVKLIIRFEAAEILFDPSYVGKEDLGCSEIVFAAINKAPIDVRAQLYENILISGGTTMFPGFPTRLYNDVTTMYKDRILKGKGSGTKVKINVIDPARRKYNVFIGASFLANIMANRPEFWISKQEWDEIGPRCLDRIGESIKV